MAQMWYEMPEVSLMARHGAADAGTVRDQIMRCLATEHGERFARQQRELGLDSSDAAVAGTIEGMVRLAFQQVGGDFDDPSPLDLTKVTNILAERSLQWGAPAETVFECHVDLMRRIGRMYMQPQ